MTTITIIRFNTVSDWLVCLDESYTVAKGAMWNFFLTLQAGVDQFGRTDHQKEELYELASQQIGLSIKTLKNYVSASRKPSTALAMDLGLEMGHAVAVLGLDEEHAEDVLQEAAEKGLSVEATRKLAWGRRGTFPDVGKSTEGEPAYNGTLLYEDSDRIGRWVRCPHCGREFEQ